MVGMNERKSYIVGLFVSVVLFIVVFYSQSNLWAARRLDIPYSGPPTGPFLPLFKYERVIKHCITGKKIGQLLANLTSSPINFPNASASETAEKRNQSFHQVFNKKEWGTNQKGDHQFWASGSGSSLHFAQETIGSLHIIISQLKLNLNKSTIRLLDVPCGDMTWMHRFLQTRDDIEYTGIDIVSDLITSHRKNFKNPQWTFLNQDVVTSPIDSYDLIMSRHMLQHLFSDDVRTLLMKFSYSGSRYLFINVHLTASRNVELGMGLGRCRSINFQLPPYSLVPPLCVVPEGEPPVFEGDHFMGLYELPLRRVPICDKINSFKYDGTDRVIHSCTPWI